MKERIAKLRQQSLDAVPSISDERARLVTEFYQSGEADRVSTPVARALAFKYILEHKHLAYNDGELIVGERGPQPKATPTYPEISTHTESDLNILHNRKKVPFFSDEATRNYLLKEIKPYWEGRSIRDRIFNELDDDWKKAYKGFRFWFRSSNRRICSKRIC